MTLVPEWAPNLHPLVVHFPIAWWVAAVAVDLVALVLRRPALADAIASFLYSAGALGAVVAYLTGRQAAATVLIPGMAHPIVQQHWNWALATTIGFAIVTLVRFWPRSWRPQPRAIRIVLVAAAVVAGVSLPNRRAGRAARVRARRWRLRTRSGRAFALSAVSIGERPAVSPSGTIGALASNAEEDVAQASTYTTCRL